MEEKIKLEIIAKKLDNKKKRFEIVESQKELLMADAKLKIDQIKNLRDLITETVVDEESTVFSSEQKYKLVFSEDEIKKLKKKIWELLDKV
jgi:hypothetical protein